MSDIGGGSEALYDYDVALEALMRLSPDPIESDEVMFLDPEYDIRSVTLELVYADSTDGPWLITEVKVRGLIGKKAGGAPTDYSSRSSSSSVTSV